MTTSHIRACPPSIPEGGAHTPDRRIRRAASSAETAVAGAGRRPSLRSFRRWCRPGDRQVPPRDATRPALPQANAAPWRSGRWPPRGLSRGVPGHGVPIADRVTGGTVGWRCRGLKCETMPGLVGAVDMSRPLCGPVRSVAMTLHHARIRSDRSFSRYPAGPRRLRGGCREYRVRWTAATDLGCRHRPPSGPDTGI